MDTASLKLALKEILSKENEIRFMSLNPNRMREIYREKRTIINQVIFFLSYNTCIRKLINVIKIQLQTMQNEEEREKEEREKKKERKDKERK